LEGREICSPVFSERLSGIRCQASVRMVCVIQVWNCSAEKTN
jgi:hypothetical protein